VLLRLFLPLSSLTKDKVNPADAVIKAKEAEKKAQDVDKSAKAAEQKADAANLKAREAGKILNASEEGTISLNKSVKGNSSGDGNRQGNTSAPNAKLNRARFCK